MYNIGKEELLMENKYLNMGTGSKGDFFEPYDRLASNAGFMDGFEFAIRAIYPNGKEKEPFVKGGKVHQILNAGMMRYSEMHTPEEVENFRLGGGVACLVSTSHETWSAAEREKIAAYTIESFAEFVCRQHVLGIPVAEDPESLSREYRQSLKKEVHATLS